MSVPRPSALILDLTVVEDLRRAVGVDRIAWHIGVDDNLAAIPVGHAVENRG
ncbi:hypothetical protein D3C80_1956220 [compost metagenome]